MWFRYLITILNIVMCLFIVFFMRGLKWGNDKASIIGFSAMLFSYIGSIGLIWW